MTSVEKVIIQNSVALIKILRHTNTFIIIRFFQLFKNYLLLKLKILFETTIPYADYEILSIQLKLILESDQQEFDLKYYIIRIP